MALPSSRGMPQSRIRGGRWKLKDDEMTGVRIIPIRGVPWDIPRVRPLRFTVQDLEAVITRARTSPPSTTSTAGVPQRIDFVWLDVTFIDQRENNPKAVSEMGRQADVFRGASFVYAWLSAISILQLNQIFGARTLQPFISSMSLRMSEESGAVTRSWSSARQAYDQAVALGVKTGLYALSLRNAVVTFILAQHRKAQREEDRIYGIQRIFNLRLGKTAPGQIGRVYSLGELEDEFAKQLLVTYPVQSQMHVFTKAIKFSTAWRLNASSVFPKMNQPYFP
jgi:hypothetical protein